MEKYWNTVLIDIDSQKLIILAEKLRYQWELLNMLKDSKIVFEPDKTRLYLHKALENELKKIQAGSENLVCNQKEFKNTNQYFLQKEIMKKAEKWTEHHRFWLKIKTYELVKNNDEKSLEQLNKVIDFTEKSGLIINTLDWQLKFAPKQASFDDVKDIPGLKNEENIWTENKVTRKKWLRVNFEAIQKIKEAEKKICNIKQYIDAVNAFPWTNQLTKNNRSEKVKDFFDLLWVNQFGFCFPNEAGWNTSICNLWTGSESDFLDRAYSILCGPNVGMVGRHVKYSALGVWFLEE